MQLLLFNAGLAHALQQWRKSKPRQYINNRVSWRVSAHVETTATLTQPRQAVRLDPKHSECTFVGAHRLDGNNHFRRVLAFLGASWKTPGLAKKPSGTSPQRGSDGNRGTQATTIIGTWRNYAGTTPRHLELPGITRRSGLEPKWNMKETEETWTRTTPEPASATQSQTRKTSRNFAIGLCGLRSRRLTFFGTTPGSFKIFHVNNSMSGRKNGRFRRCAVECLLRGDSFNC